MDVLIFSIFATLWGFGFGVLAEKLERKRRETGYYDDAIAAVREWRAERHGHHGHAPEHY